MPTALQEKLAEKIIENATSSSPIKSKKGLIESVGYSGDYADNRPSEIINAKGTQEALRKRGFNPETAKEVVGEIMLNDEVAPSDRLRACGEVFKVCGSYAPEKQIHVDVNLRAYAELNDEQLAKLLADDTKQLNEPETENMSKDKQTEITPLEQNKTA